MSLHPVHLEDLLKCSGLTLETIDSAGIYTVPPMRSARNWAAWLTAWCRPWPSLIPDVMALSGLRSGGKIISKAPSTCNNLRPLTISTFPPQLICKAKVLCW